MVERLRISPGGFLLTRPGIDVSKPGLTDREKLIDSNWNFSGGIIAAGEMTDPAPAVGNEEETTTSSPLVITFPSPGYVPCVVVTQIFPDSFPFSHMGGFGFYRESTRGIYDGSKVYENRIELVRQQFGNGRYFRFRGRVIYRVFAVR